MEDYATEEKISFKGKKIFVVEDDRFLHRLLMDEMRQLGAEVFSSFEGNSTIESIRKEKPDIIVLDIILPGMDGFTVLEKLKADTELKHIPVIILTNLGQEDDIKKGTALGAEDFLIKANFTLDEITQKVSRVLKKREQKQKNLY